MNNKEEIIEKSRSSCIEENKLENGLKSGDKCFVNGLEFMYTPCIILEIKRNNYKSIKIKSLINNEEDYICGYNCYSIDEVKPVFERYEKRINFLKQYF